jgi:hypothetical protein
MRKRKILRYPMHPNMPGRVNARFSTGVEIALWQWDQPAITLGMIHCWVTHIGNFGTTQHCDWHIYLHQRALPYSHAKKKTA